jgi:hypothetical protein
MNAEEVYRKSWIGRMRFPCAMCLIDRNMTPEIKITWVKNITKIGTRYCVDEKASGMGLECRDMIPLCQTCHVEYMEHR